MAGAGGLNRPDLRSLPWRQQRRPVFICLGAVLLLHTLLLIEWSGAPAQPLTASTGHRPPQRMRVRELHPGAADHAAPEPAHSVPAEPVAATPPSDIASAQVSAAASQAPSAAAIDAPAPELTRDTELYLPRSALSQGASAIGWVDVPYPPGAPLGQYRTELTLYIDETGTVRRVRVDRGDAPAALQDAARQAFLNARFQPGEVNGQPVKSRLHIEVEFSAEALPQH